MWLIRGPLAWEYRWTKTRLAVDETSPERGGFNFVEGQP
jgi:hypothetical protein